jgi:hypothetical protein
MLIGKKRDKIDYKLEILQFNLINNKRNKFIYFFQMNSQLILLFRLEKIEVFEVEIESDREKLKYI